MKDYRSAKTGRYMKKEEALEDKTTSVAETRKRRAPKKPKKEKPDAQVSTEENQDSPVQETVTGEDSSSGSTQQPEDKTITEDAGSVEEPSVQVEKQTPEFDENDKLNLPVSFIYKGDRFLQGEDVYETEPEAQEAILKKLLKMMGEE